jgi:hypothetical protein
VVLPIVLAVTLTTVAALLVLMLAFFRHLKLLAGSVASFSRDVQPLLEDIQRQSLAAQERLDRLSQRGSVRLTRGTGEGDPGETAGN